MNQLTLRVGGVPEHFNLPWHLACEQDRFAPTGTRVEFTEWGGGTGQMTAALQENRLDVAVLLLEGALKKILNEGGYRIVKLFTDTPLTWGIHVAADSPIQEVAGIRGKRYAISRTGSGSHLIAIVDACERGWPTSEMDFVEIADLAGARKSLASGAADVFFWEKFMTKPLVDGGEFRRVAERVVPWPAFVVAVRDEILETAASQVRGVLQTLATVCADLKRDPAAARVISERYDLKLDDTRQWLARTEWNQDFEYPQAAFQSAFDYLRLLGLLDDPDTDFRRGWFSLDGDSPGG